MRWLTAVVRALKLGRLMGSQCQVTFLYESTTRCTLCPLVSLTAEQLLRAR